jgi:hypothetical protein
MIDEPGPAKFGGDFVLVGPVKDRGNSPEA